MTNTPSNGSEAAFEELFGPQTRLAVQNFPSYGRRLSDSPEVLRAYAWVKAAAARANADLGVLDTELAEAIVSSCEEIVQGKHDPQFPTALVQGGGGTSTNMNLNEVIASRGTQLVKERNPELQVHPNDHVNRSQSTNDSYPTAMALAMIQLAQPTLKALHQLEESLLKKAEEFDTVHRLGRTCLQDAVPLTVGQTHRAQAAAMNRHRRELKVAVENLSAVPLGATAIGTGVGAPEGYSALAVSYLAELSGHPLSVSENFFDALAHMDPYASLASAVVRPAITMAKIAADFRILSSGPVGGIGELNLPARQAGSSIMPGKVNPVIPELVMQLSYRIRGSAHTVELGVAAGELELNIMEPIVLDALMNMMTDLSEAANALGTKCIDGLIWNQQGLAQNLQGSLQSLVELAETHGYQTATQTLNTLENVDALEDVDK